MLLWELASSGGLEKCLFLTIGAWRPHTLQRGRSWAKLQAMLGCAEEVDGSRERLLGLLVPQRELELVEALEKSLWPRRASPKFPAEVTVRPQLFIAPKGSAKAALCPLR
ncbi:hypothetical protein NDU88_003656 [Pleurodeles waltl]|uniref:Uncharacterized protein n=1 Tax=Pleurodeles waltl TaxID=8319 RepID=A0AAV7MRC0_PLEWA|nr:hypothetical protein NDU88_003656 [Pleurodeles waltl]